MKASYCWLALAVAAAAGVAPAADPPAAVPGVLLLDDFRIVEGQVERFGKLYRVTAGGKAQLIPAIQVLRHAATRAEVKAAPSGTWQDRLDPDQIALCETAMNRRLRSLGYELSGAARPGPAVLARYAKAGGTFLVCPLCFSAKHLDQAGLIDRAELGGTVQRWEWIGDGAATFSL